MLTFDVDVWIEDAETNLSRCEKALGRLKAEWGRSDNDWRPVVKRNPGWMKRQAVFCLACPHGAIDVFRRVKGLRDWRAWWQRAVRGKTGALSFRGLSDRDMLRP